LLDSLLQDINKKLFKQKYMEKGQIDKIYN